MIAPRADVELADRLQREPWVALGPGRRGIPPAHPWPLALAGGALRVPRPLPLGGAPADRQVRLFECLARVCRTPDALALCDALAALRLTGRLAETRALDDEERWRVALAVAVAGCWSERRPRVIGVERWPELCPDAAESVFAVLERVATEGHGVISSQAPLAGEPAATWIRQAAPQRVAG